MSACVYSDVMLRRAEEQHRILSTVLKQQQKNAPYMPSINPGYLSRKLEEALTIVLVKAATRPAMQIGNVIIT